MGRNGRAVPCSKNILSKIQSWERCESSEHTVSGAGSRTTVLISDIHVPTNWTVSDFIVWRKWRWNSLRVPSTISRIFWVERYTPSLRFMNSGYRIYKRLWWIIGMPLWSLRHDCVKLLKLKMSHKNIRSEPLRIKTIGLTPSLYCWFLVYMYL